MQTGTNTLRELTVRYTVKKDHDGQPLAIGWDLGHPRDAAGTLMTLLQNEPSEVFGILCLSTKHRVIAYHEVGRGTLDAVLVRPRLCSAQHKRGYVAEGAMWPWPWRAADYRDRHVIAAT